MSLRGKTIQHPNCHEGPSLSSPTLFVLDPGLDLQLVGFENDYFRVVLQDGRQGFVHRDLIVMDGAMAPNLAAAGAASKIVRGTTIQRPNFHTHASESSPTTEVLATGVALELLGLENDYWHVRLPDGRTGFVHTDLVVAARGTAPQPAAGTVVVSIANPFDQTVHVTASSLSGHHTPFGGDAACDLDTAGPSRGTPVRFRVSCNGGVRVRGRVGLIGMACKSGRIEDGGRWLQLVIEKDDGGQWVSTGKQVNYVHLDPVSVAVGQIVEDGQELGRLGPGTPASFPHDHPSVSGCVHPAGSPMLDEYHSSCAFHSHTHIEGTGSPWVNDEGVVCASDDTIMRFVL